MLLFELIISPDNSGFVTIAKRGNCSNGCMLCFDGVRPVGYIFCRTFGTIGYMGPLGVNPGDQDKGFGKLIVQEGIKYLQRKNCQVIGLETLPEWGKNIGLYHKLGFRAYLPARVMEKSLNIKTQGLNLPQGTYSGSDISYEDTNRIIYKISEWTDKIYPGLDLSKDIIHFLQYYPERILFAFSNHEVSGFIAFHPEFNRYAWGAIQPSPEDRVHFMRLVNAAESLKWESKLTFRFHTHFHRITDLLFECGFQLRSDMTFMLLKDFAGEFGEKSDALFMRSWVG